MKHKLLFIDFTDDGCQGPRSCIPHDRGGFFFPPPLPRGGGRLFVSSGGDHGDRRWLSSSTHLVRCWVTVFNQLCLGRGRHPYVTSPMSVFAAKLSFEFHGLNNWATLLLGLCYLILGLSPVHSPPSTRLKEAKWWWKWRWCSWRSWGNNCPLPSPSLVSEASPVFYK